MPDGQSISAAGGSRHKAEKGGFLVLTHLGLSEFNFSVMHNTPLSGRLNPISILVLRDRHLHHLLPMLLAPSIRGTFRCRRMRRVNQTNPARAGRENDAEVRDLL